jgi:hypothetical protein
MKIYIVAALFLVLLCLPSLAQSLPGGLSPRYDETDNRQLIEKYYAAVLAKGAHMVNNWGLELGARLGFITMNQHLNMGFGFYSLLSQNIKVSNSNYPDPYSLRLSYGGAELQYSVKPASFVRLSAGALVGGGKTSFASVDKNQATHTLPGQWFTIIEPSLKLDFRLSNALWIGPSLNYRKVFGINDLNLHDNDFSKLAVSLTLTSFIY